MSEGARFQWDLILDAYEGTEIAFDDDGQPTTQLVMNPRTAMLLQAMEKTPSRSGGTRRSCSGRRTSGMLSNVLGAYLDRIKEREFDLPFALLLPSLGYSDVHRTHGAVEYGTDFIAKKVEDGTPVQYSFQVKRGDIALATWRNEVRGQVESAQSGLPHPHFDPGLERQVVLVTTGELTQPAWAELRQFNEDRQNRSAIRPMQVWTEQNLLEFLLGHGLNGVHRATAGGFGEFGRFFLTYSRALQGVITVREISGTRGSGPMRISIRSGACSWPPSSRKCWPSNAWPTTWSTRRSSFTSPDSASSATSDMPTERCRRASSGTARWSSFTPCAATTSVGCAKRGPGTRTCCRPGPATSHMNTYPVQCARIIEIASLAYFTAADGENRDQYVEFVAEFVQAEPGCAHPSATATPPRSFSRSSCYWTASASMSPSALLERATVWLYDHYHREPGLAGVEADEELETATLLGSAFDFIDIHPRPNSFLATALLDLAAFSGNPELYADMVNDVKAVRIVPEYWQPRDSIGAVRIEGKDVLQYPHVEFTDALPIDGSPYADHLPDEPATFRFVEAYGGTAAVALIALLRDRYFPKLFPPLAPNHAR